MSSFATIYVSNCTKRGEIPVHKRIYQDLDEVWNWIESREELSSALDGNRLCITVPAPFPVSDAPKIFYDIKSENGQAFYFYDPATDKFRAEILNKLAGQKVSSDLLKWHGGEREVILWKIKILEKRFKLKTWEEYAGTYR